MAEGRRKIKQLEAMVAEVITETPDTVTLVLFTGNDRLSYKPGHFLTIEPHQFAALERWVDYLEDLKGRREPPRAYSLSSSPDEKYIAITIKEERYISNVTKYPPLLSPILARRTLPGTRMVVTGFTGPYTMSEEAASKHNDVVHICAGSGVVPSFSIIKQGLRMFDSQRHTLVYSNKLFSDIIFKDQLEGLQEQFPDRLKVLHTLTREVDHQPTGGDIRSGRVTLDLVREAIPDPTNAALFVCGPDHNVWQKKAAKEREEALPPSFLNTVLDHLDQLGVPKNNITKESYG